MIKIISPDRLSQEARSLPRNSVVFLLLGGDRLACCDEAAIMEIDGRVVAMATIAPLGEEQSGQPTIVGVYVVPAYRGQGHGGAVFKAALDRCQERGFSQVRVDIMSTGMAKIIASLPEAERSLLQVYDLERTFDLFRE